jgi:uncharacterized protein (TIGR02594 family)
VKEHQNMTPKWYALAEAELGQAEVPGREHNPRILEYLEVAGFQDVQNDDDAWCAVFANWALIMAGHPGTQSRMARSFLGYGKTLAKPVKGCIVVLKRDNNPAQGHVGFFSHAKDKRVYLLGGNQSNKVSIASFPEGDVLAYRMPHDTAKVDRKVVVGTGTAAGTGVGMSVPTDSIPVPPDLTSISAWKAFGQTLIDIGGWALSNPLVTAGLGAWVVGVVFWTQIKTAWAEWRTS